MTKPFDHFFRDDHYETGVFEGAGCVCPPVQKQVCSDIWSATVYHKVERATRHFVEEIRQPLWWATTA